MTAIHPVNVDVTRNVRAILSTYDLPQKILMDWLGVKEAQVSRLMASDQEWRLRHLAKLASRVHVDVSTLVGPKKTLLEALPDDLPQVPLQPDPDDVKRLYMAQRTKGRYPAGVLGPVTESSGVTRVAA